MLNNENEKDAEFIVKYPLKANKDPSKLDDQQESKYINGVKMNSI
jgi:hypothetical protein